MAKASYWNGSDGEGRRLGERSGLDTDFYKSAKYPGSPSSKRCPFGVTDLSGVCSAGA